MERLNFAGRVLLLCKKIPKGKVTTYKILAEAAGRKNAYRAVGTILKKNKNPKDIPCYRVVKSSGHVGNYSLGIRKKIKLLRKDGIPVVGEKIKNLERFLFTFR